MPGLSTPTDFILSKARLQRSYNWDVLLPDIDLSAGGLIGFGLGQLVREVQFQDYTIDNPNTMRYGPYQAHFAGLFTVIKLCK
jgi:hypothetical protein